MIIPPELAQIYLPFKLAPAIIELVEAAQDLAKFIATGASTQSFTEKLQLFTQQFLISHSDFEDIVEWSNDIPESTRRYLSLLTPLMVVFDMREAGLEVEWRTLAQYYLVDTRKAFARDSKAEVLQNALAVGSTIDQKPIATLARPRLRMKRGRTSHSDVVSKRRRSTRDAPIVVEDSDDDDKELALVPKNGLDRPSKGVSTHAEPQVSEGRYAPAPMAGKEIGTLSDLEDLYYPPRDPFPLRDAPSSSKDAALPTPILPTPAPSYSEHGHLPRAADKSPLARRPPFNGSASYRRRLTPIPTSPLHNDPLLPIGGIAEPRAIEVTRLSDAASEPDSPLPPPTRPRRPLRGLLSSPENRPHKLHRIRRMGEDNTKAENWDSPDNSDSENESCSGDSVSGSSESKDEDVTSVQGSSPLRRKHAKEFNKTSYPIHLIGFSRCETCTRAGKQTCYKKRRDGACALCNSRRQKCSTCTRSKSESQLPETPRPAGKKTSTSNVGKGKEISRGVVAVSHPHPRSSQAATGFSFCEDGLDPGA